MSGQAGMDADKARASEPVVSRGSEAFARAERHSRRVRRLKIWLPTIAAIGIVGFVAWSYLAIPGIEGVTADGAAVTDGKLVMANPKLDGFTRDNLPYSMTAARATQELGNTGVIHLEDIDAKLPVSAENTANIIAQRGIYDNSKNTLTIDSAIKLTTTDGMVAHFQSANLDIKAGKMTTNDPVDITLNGAKIAADTFSVTDHGKVMVFERRVRVEITPKADSTKTSGTGEPHAAK